MTTRTASLAPLLLIVGLVAAALPGCGMASPPESASLTIATDDVAETPAGEVILAFADEVAERSDGAITIEPVWHAAGDVDDWDQANAQLVSAGEADLGLIPARAWDVDGVTTLRALNAPFLITTNEALEAVLSDESLVDDLLAGLSEVSVSGIDLIPEGLRHPVGFGAPLLGVGSYAGELIRTPRSDTGEALFAALGASTTGSEFDDLRGSEISFALANDGIATANVVFYPKVQALVANNEVWNGLSNAQRTILSDAAAAVKRAVFETWPDENDAAAAFCEAGGDLVAATEAELAGLRAAVQPVYEELNMDVKTADLIAAIRAIAAGTSADPPLTQCETGPDAAAASALNGSYTVTVTPEALTAAGVTDQQVFDEYAGDRTIELEDGAYVIGYANGGGEDWSGSYDVVGTRFIWHWTSAAEDWTEADTMVQPDGSIVFSNWEDGGGDEWLRGAQVAFSTWTKVG